MGHPSETIESPSETEDSSTMLSLTSYIMHIPPSVSNSIPLVPTSKVVLVYKRVLSCGTCITLFALRSCQLCGTDQYRKLSTFFKRLSKSKLHSRDIRLACRLIARATVLDWNVRYPRNISNLHLGSHLGIFWLFSKFIINNVRGVSKRACV